MSRVESIEGRQGISGKAHHDSFGSDNLVPD
jgi:hypothetical protein